MPLRRRPRRPRVRRWAVTVITFDHSNASLTSLPALPYPTFPGLANYFALSIVGGKPALVLTPPANVQAGAGLVIEGPVTAAGVAVAPLAASVASLDTRVDANVTTLAARVTSLDIEARANATALAASLASLDSRATANATALQADAAGLRAALAQLNDTVYTPTPPPPRTTH